VLVRDPALDFSDDTAGKPVAINKHIGRLSSITPNAERPDRAACLFQ
jgi:hypothetical protein